MKNALRYWSAASALAIGIIGSTTAQPASLDGRWAATLQQGTVAIPFRLDISGEGTNAVGTLYNGAETETTTSALVQNGVVNETSITT